MADKAAAPVKEEAVCVPGDGTVHDGRTEFEHTMKKVKERMGIK